MGRESTKRAVDAYYQKQYDTAKKTRKKNKKPEKEVEKDVMLWLNAHGFDCNVIESKAVFNPKAGRFLNSQAAPGMTDIVGNTDYGVAVFIELKAPGCRVASHVSDVQRFFLMRKIQSHCFAIVCDSIGYLENTYNHWMALDREKKKEFLFNEIPQPRQSGSKDGAKENEPLF